MFAMSSLAWTTVFLDEAVYMRATTTDQRRHRVCSSSTYDLEFLLDIGGCQQRVVACDANVVNLVLGHFAKRWKESDALEILPLAMSALFISVCFLICH